MRPSAFASISKTVDLKDNDAFLALVQSCIGTKFSVRWGDRVIEMAVQATLRVVQERR